ncbi:MAG: haloalkane dehalogenase [Candidatus Hodarchaeota archaeon]
MIEFLRTPEDRFDDISNFPYKPLYIEDLNGYEGLRMHYIDEGPKDSEEIFLCLHGEPTWAYLYRKMIPVFLKAGYRVITPDFLGFGRSDKPVKDEIYTYDFHRNFLIEFIKYLDLKNITMVGQDWGGIYGLTLPMEMPDRFKRFLIMNAIIPTGDFELSQGFLLFRDFVRRTPDFEAGRLIKSVTPILTQEDVKAYNAPFPDITYKAGIRRFPMILPDNVDAPGAAISGQAADFLSNKWEGETFMAIGMQDPVLGPPIMERVRKAIRNCSEPFHVEDAGHFVQEWGELVAEKALEYFKLS